MIRNSPSFERDIYEYKKLNSINKNYGQPSFQKYQYPLEQSEEISKTQKSNNKNEVTINRDEILRYNESISKKYKLIRDTIEISKQKNKLKDQQVLTYFNEIEKKVEKIKYLEKKLKDKEAKLQKVSLMCHQLTQDIMKENEKTRKQEIIKVEEQNKCENLEQNIGFLEENLIKMNKQLERRRATYENLQNLEQTANNLRQTIQKLETQNKIEEFKVSHEQKQIIDMQKRLKQLNKMCKQRNDLNAKNKLKLKKAETQVSKLQESVEIAELQKDETQKLQYEIGELNQELLLINQQIIERESEIRDKKKRIESYRENKQILQKEKTQFYTNRNPNQATKSKQGSTYKIIQSEEDDGRKQTAQKNTNVFNQNRQPLKTNIKSVDEFVLPIDKQKDWEHLMMKYETIKNKQKMRQQ